MFECGAIFILIETLFTADVRTKVSDSESVRGAEHVHTKLQMRLCLIWQCVTALYVIGLWILWLQNLWQGWRVSHSFDGIQNSIEFVLLIGLTAAFAQRPIGFQALWQGVGLFFALSLLVAGVALVFLAPQLPGVWLVASALIMAMLPAVIIVLRYGYSNHLWSPPGGDRSEFSGRH